MKKRQSSIELLRILAIFCVLKGHSDIILNGGVSPSAGIYDNPVTFFISNIVDSCVVCGVDVFVLISGWFGIHATTKGLAKFIYQVAFLLWGIYLGFLISGNAEISLENIKATFGIYDGYWFVMAYLGMYILSPVLNAFAENVTKRQFEALLICFYAFQCYYCWGWGMVNYFQGYSIVFFCGLYLTTRYMRLYHVKILYNYSLIVFVVAVVLIAIVSFIGLWTLGSPIRMMRYDNPLVILSASAILLVFSKLKFQSKVLNNLARSCFAVYIVHFNPLVFPYFKQGVLYVASLYGGMTSTFLLFLYLIMVYFACSVIDSIRMFSWSLISKYIFK